MDQHDTTDPGDAEPPRGTIFDEVAAYLDGDLTPPGFDPAGDAPFVVERVGAYEVIDEEFVFADGPADWHTANPALGYRASVDWIAEQRLAALASSSFTHKLADGVRKQAGRGLHADRVILDESDLLRFREAASAMKFELVEWQEDAVRRMFGLDVVPNDDRMPALISGPMYFGPVGAFYDECTTGPFLDAALWDAVPRTPRNDPEMLNGVIDDISTDVTAKIARTECPKFPRVD
jgi:hypothetical protein